jgi:hypothetical protein
MLRSCVWCAALFGQGEEQNSYIQSGQGDQRRGIQNHQKIITRLEAEETSIVYGMLRAVVEAGLSDRSVPLTLMADAFREVV